MATEESSAVPSTKAKPKDSGGTVPKEKRLYKVWPTKSKFFCDGICITGGAEDCCWVWFPCMNIVTWTCILLPCTIFFVFVWKVAWEDWHPTICILIVLVFTITVTSLLLTCCSEPGIIPRRSVILGMGPEAVQALTARLGYNPLGEGEPTHNWSTDRTKMVPESLRCCGYRWCHTCEIVRPPRASHCADCDNCVMRFDHHCPFVNNCVGQRNYVFFMSFVTSLSILALLVLPALFFFFVTPKDSVAKNNGDDAGGGEADTSSESSNDTGNPLLVVGLIIGGLIALAGVASLGLWCYHVHLIARGKTTKEHLKKIENLDQDPTLFAPRGPQLFYPRQLVNVDIVKMTEGKRLGKPMGVV